MKLGKITISQIPNSSCNHTKDNSETVNNIMAGIQFSLGECTECNKFVMKIGDCTPWQKIEASIEEFYTK